MIGALSETFRGRRAAAFVDQTDLDEHYLPYKFTYTQHGIITWRHHQDMYRSAFFVVRSCNDFLSRSTDSDYSTHRQQRTDVKQASSQNKFSVFSQLRFILLFQVAKVQKPCRQRSNPYFVLINDFFKSKISTKRFITAKIFLIFIGEVWPC